MTLPPDDDGLPEGPRAIIKAFEKIGNEYFPIVLDDYGNEKRVIWAPLPWSQQYFLGAPEFEALYEGTRGPGKTLTLLMDFCQEVGKGYGAEWRGMLIRRTYPELDDIKNMSKKWIKRMWPEAFFNEIKNVWQWPTGELLSFRAIPTVNETDAHLGTNYTWLGWEELTLWPDPAAFKRMQAVVRSSLKDIPKRIRSTTNSYGKGHNWVQARYNLVNWPVKIGEDPNAKDPCLRDIWKVCGPLVEGTTDEDGIPEPTRRAYHGSLRENIILMRVQPQYINQLKSSARNQAELDSWLYGRWDITAGGMFDDIWATHREYIVVKDFVVPGAWRIYRAYDHGSTKPWSCGWYAESNGEDLTFEDGSVLSTLRGDLFRCGELYGNLKNSSDQNTGRRQTIPSICKELIEYEIARGWRDANSGKSRVRRGPADTHIFAEEDGRPSVASDFETPCIINGHRWRGIIWERADKRPGSREQGWEQSRKRLKATKREPGGIREEKALFIVGSRCPHWLRTVPVLPRDDGGGGRVAHLDDVDTESEDHIGDEMRYMLRYDPGTMRSGTTTDFRR
jgi:hypothetical protein